VYLQFYYLGISWVRDEKSPHGLAKRYPMRYLENKINVPGRHADSCLKQRLMVVGLPLELQSVQEVLGCVLREVGSDLNVGLAD